MRFPRFRAPPATVSPRHRLAVALLALAALAAAPAASAQPKPDFLPKSQAVGGNPGPAYNYVCPNLKPGDHALDCFFDAVKHLYTMCKHVKSIEIIEYGYEKSTEGSNGAKSEYCVDKQKASMTRPYQVALKEAGVSVQAAEMVRSLHEYWIASLAALAWKPGESDDDYKARTAKPYEVFDERIAGIRTVVGTVRERTNAPPPTPLAKSQKPATNAKAAN